MDPKNSQGPDRVDYQEHPGDLTEVHASIQREHPEPTAESTPVPMWLIATCGLAVCWAGLYLGLFNGGFKGDVFNELNTSASLLFPAPQKSGGPAAAAAEPTLAEQGKAVYATCAACHQANGLGQPGAIPPLAKSPYVVGSEKRLAAIILKGLKGPVTVNGATFNSQMQAWEGTLSNKKLAAVASFVRSAFGNTAGPVTEAQMAAARKEFEAHKDQMTEPEILQIPEDATLPGGDAAGGAPAGGAAAPAGGAPAPAASAGNAGAPPAGTAPAAGAAPAAGGAPPATGAPPTGTTPPTPGTPPANPAPPARAAAAPTPEQMAAGKAAYMTCMPCHQMTGTGLPPVFPPLTKSPYVNGSAERFIAMVLKGNMGPMTIDGKPYNNIMPPQEATLNDEKIAAVTTYVRNSFGNSAPPIATEQVAATRAKFAERKTGWTQPELDAWAE